MLTITHDQITAKVGEPVQVTFTVTDETGAPVSVVGATAAYKIARRNGDTAILTKTDGAGITLATNTAVVLFNTTDVVVGSVQAVGDLHDQISITKAGVTLLVAEGIVTIEQVVA